MITSDTKHFYSTIDSIYLNSSKTGLMTQIKPYFIGKVENFKKINN